MNIEGQITILCSKNGVEIEIQDVNSRAMFCKVKMTAEDFTAALGRLASNPCNIEVRGLDVIGKKQEVETHEFEIQGRGREYKKDELYELAKQTAPHGWEPDKYFNSQNSFFSKDGKNYARCTIRRWV